MLSSRGLHTQYKPAPSEDWWHHSLALIPLPVKKTHFPNCLLTYMKLAPTKSNYDCMMWIMEIGEGGFCSDRLVELINYCVAGDCTTEKRELCSWDTRIGRSGGISPLLQGLSMQCSRHCQGKSMLKRISDQLHRRSRCQEKVYSTYMGFIQMVKMKNN